MSPTLLEFTNTTGGACLSQVRRSEAHALLPSRSIHSNLPLVRARTQTKLQTVQTVVASLTRSGSHVIGTDSRHVTGSTMNLANDSIKIANRKYKDHKYFCTQGALQPGVD